MHQRLPRRRDVEQRVALRRHLRHAPADQEHEVGVLDARDELRVRPDAEIAGISRVVGRKQHLAAERGRDRQVEALGEAREALHGLRRPARCRRGSRSGASPPRAASAARPSGRAPGWVSTGSKRQARRRRSRVSVSMSSGSAIDDRAGPALHRDVEGARDELGNARRVVDLRRPISPSVPKTAL